MTLLNVTGLHKKFGGLIAVNDLDFNIEQGELLSIIGPNGAGKTTLFNLLTGIYKPTSGHITINEHDITGCKPHEAARYGIARTFQLTTVFSDDTVLDNVLVGKSIHAKTGVLGTILKTPSNNKKERLARDKARELLAFVGLADQEDKPAGSLTEEAQKRLSIAIGLAIEPKLLLLDEPTGGVNIEEIEDLMKLIEKIRENGVTICLIEHKMRMVMSISDRIVALNYGQKIAEGKPSEVANNEQVIKAYLGGRDAA
jgi:branched-chain amino acid transport system ATP-binding protein